MDPAIAHAGSRESLIGADATVDLERAYSCEHHVSTATPPVFMTLANDDASVVPENAVRFYLALRRAGVSAEMHVFEAGGHGHSIRNAFGPVRQWMALCVGWLEKMLPPT